MCKTLKPRLHRGIFSDSSMFLHSPNLWYSDLLVIILKGILHSPSFTHIDNLGKLKELRHDIWGHFFDGLNYD